MSLPIRWSLSRPASYNNRRSSFQLLYLQILTNYQAPCMVSYRIWYGNKVGGTLREGGMVAGIGIQAWVYSIYALQAQSIYPIHSVYSIASNRQSVPCIHAPHPAHWPPKKQPGKRKRLIPAPSLSYPYLCWGACSCNPRLRAAMKKIHAPHPTILSL